MQTPFSRFCFASICGAGLLLTSCDQKTSSPPSRPATNATVKTTTPPDPSTPEVTPAFPPLVLDDFDDKLPATEADRAWREVARGLQMPEVPPAWRTQEPTEAELAAFEKKRGAAALQAADQAKQFYTKYPDHPQAKAAQQQEYDLLNFAAQSGGTNVQERLQAWEEARLKDPSLTEDERVELRVQQLVRSAAAGANDGEMTTNGLASLEKGARALQKDFPKRGELAGLILSIAEGWLAKDDLAKSRALAQEVVQGEAESDVKEAAQALLRKTGRVGQPLNLQFKALDGREVDVKAMKGKVVLLDFWATWCGPCMSELPKVKTAYDKLHERGFEIIGISFDQDQEALERVLAREKITWPQHFESGGSGSKFGEEFEINGIPAMWLVDKKGNLRDLNARENLAEKVEKLLAEK